MTCVAAAPEARQYAAGTGAASKTTVADQAAVDETLGRDAETSGPRFDEKQAGYRAPVLSHENACNDKAMVTCPSATATLVPASLKVSPVFTAVAVHRPGSCQRSSSIAGDSMASAAAMRESHLPLTAAFPSAQRHRRHQRRREKG